MDNQQLRLHHLKTKANQVRLTQKEQQELISLFEKNYAEVVLDVTYDPIDVRLLPLDKLQQTVEHRSIKMDLELKFITNKSIHKYVIKANNPVLTRMNER